MPLFTNFQDIFLYCYNKVELKLKKTAIMKFNLKFKYLEQTVNNLKTLLDNCQILIV